MKPAVYRFLLVTVLIASGAGLPAGCAQDDADPPWVPPELAGLRVTQITVHDHGYTSSDFVTHGLALLADGTVMPFDAIEGAVSLKARPAASMPVRSLVGGDCAVLADDTVHCIENGAWVVVATGVLDFVPTREVNGRRGTETVECALTAAGELRCGLPHEPGTLFDGVALDAGGHQFVSVTAGGAAICALTDAGIARCWEGLEDTGVDLPLSDVVEVAVGAFHACVRLGDGTARCWGDNTDGELGAGPLGSGEEIETVVGLTDIVQLVADSRHTCARRASGAVLCWGASGVLVDLEPEERFTPQPIPGVASAVDLVASAIIDCAAMENEDARCWGTSHRTGVELSPPSSGFFIPGR